MPRVTHLSAHMGTATSTPELRRLVERLSREYELVAADRSGVTRALTSPRVRQVIRRRGIELVSYADVLRQDRADRRR